MSCFSDIPLIKGKKFLVLSILALTIILNSCLDETVSSYSEETKITQWAPNIKYAVAYNEEKTVLQTTWPGGKVAGFSKASSDGSEGLLVDYSYQRVETTVDNKGYLAISSKYLDGSDSWMHMPSKVYYDLEDSRPSKPADYDPYIASEMRDGQAFLITRSGRNIPTFSYNFEEYRLDPTEIDSMLGLLTITDSSVTSEKLKQRYEGLNKKYGNVNMLNKYLAAVETNFSNCCADDIDEKSDLSRVKKVIDLRYGTIVREGLVDSQGRIVSLSFIAYKKVNGFMIERFRKTYEKVEENGRFFTKYVRYNERNNIDVYWN